MSIILHTEESDPVVDNDPADNHCKGCDGEFRLSEICETCANCKACCTCHDEIDSDVLDSLDECPFYDDDPRCYTWYSMRAVERQREARLWDEE